MKRASPTANAVGCTVPLPVCQQLTRTLILMLSSASFVLPSSKRFKPGAVTGACTASMTKTPRLLSSRNVVRARSAMALHAGGTPSTNEGTVAVVCFVSEVELGTEAMQETLAAQPASHQHARKVIRGTASDMASHSTQLLAKMCARICEELRDR